MSENGTERTARSGSVFLPKGHYRKQRLADGLRIWPVIGAVFLALPLLWEAGGRSTVVGMLYLFGIWAIMIGAGVLLSALVRRAKLHELEEPPE